MFCIPVVSKYWSRVHRHAFQQNPSGAAGGPAYRGSGAREDPEQYRLARGSAWPVSPVDSALMSSTQYVLLSGQPMEVNVYDFPHWVSVQRFLTGPMTSSGTKDS